MKKLFFFIAFFTSSFLCAQKAYISPEIKPYVDYINKCNKSPVDYVMELFEKYDVVVLGERDHRDTTQYTLIKQIISDPRFIDKVGHIITEMGVYNMADELNTVLQGNYSHDSIFDLELVKVQFDLQFLPLWEKTNYTQFHRDVYSINKKLPADKKISVCPSDIQFSWNEAKNMTAEEFKPFLKIWRKKDIIMGHNTINELYKIFKGTDPRRKALIIYNSPHACRFYKNKNYEDMEFYAYQIISDRFPKRCANISLNWVALDAGAVSLTNDGKWDAAFAACGNKSIGFDLDGTPFGESLFDMGGGWPPVDKIKYKDVFHGFIFYKPVDEWIEGRGVPNLDKLNCKDELARRAKVFKDVEITEEEKTGMYEDFSIIIYRKIFTGEVLTKMYKQIEQYYRPAGK